ncbi:exodeoxyribonuclease VII small subunit [Ruania alkalisoli]|uniref:Exodeoxyribonuclease 7 small subunit n=1 Tax=Ruania alkalisoli TaxID=2779775 RepID=A0A7M1SR09_9MICO|nr:exodeoxyribonuclease VII small subunit [Ruania alkalisoli]QOR69881.1 exodeoxyribonuclease VII small subunit [Ruania alkalisoli]
MTCVSASTDVRDLSYEQARDELVEVVNKLESGAASLEESLDLWERGEALADRCQSWLDAARARIDATRGASAETSTDPDDENSGEDEGEGTMAVTNEPVAASDPDEEN